MSLDGTLRDATIIPGSDGTVVPDEQPLLASSPQLVMEPGVVRPSWKFEDGDGLTDAFGNVYVGYGGAGGGSSIIVNDGGEQIVDDDIGDVEDLDFLQFDFSRQLYVPRTYDEANISKNTVADFDAIHIDKPEDKNYKIINGTPYEIRITSISWELEVGTANSVSLTQLGTVGPAGDQEIIVDAPSLDARGLIVMIFYEYDQNEFAAVL